MADLPEMNVELPLKDAYQDLVHPAAAEIGKTVALPFRAVNVLLTPIAKWVMQGEAKLDEISRLVSEEVKDVSEEKLTDPEPYVAVPAMQAITYSMDCDDLKKMYAKLLAKAINADEKDKVHPAYVEIIKQMSPLDARVLNAISQDHPGYFPICGIRFQGKQPKYSELLPSFRRITLGYDLFSHLVPRFVPDVQEESITVSIENLNRLGMISIMENYHLEESTYVAFESSPLVDRFRVASNNFSNQNNYEFALIGNSGHLTELGKEFCRVCLS